MSNTVAQLWAQLIAIANKTMAQLPGRDGAQPNTVNVRNAFWWYCLAIVADNEASKLDYWQRINGALYTLTNTHRHYVNNRAYNLRHYALIMDSLNGELLYCLNSCHELLNVTRLINETISATMYLDNDIDYDEVVLSMSYALHYENGEVELNNITSFFEEMTAGNWSMAKYHAATLVEHYDNATN